MMIAVISIRFEHIAKKSLVFLFILPPPDHYNSTSRYFQLLGLNISNLATRPVQTELH